MTIRAILCAVFSVSLLIAARALAADRTDSEKSAAETFPLKVSANRRYLVDHSNRPFLVIGDTPWSLIADLKEQDIEMYLDDRSRRGFNAVIVNLIEHKFATDPPRTRTGIEPFTRPGDFSTPNPAYFDFARKVIDSAGKRGISVWLCPAYLGWGGGDQGFFQEINAGGREKLKAYGKFLGSRFQDCPNIVWVIGGDYKVPKEHRWALIDLAAAIHAAGARQLMTVHGGGQSAVDVVGEQPWIDVNNTYSYQAELFRSYRNDFTRKTTRPFVLMESTYENEHNSTPQQIRRQAYWALTCGACGQFFGNNPIWHFDGPGLFATNKSWREELGSAGSQDMSRLKKAFIDRPWQRMVPDFKHKIVTEGAGEGVASVTAAATPDGRLAMIYVPSTGSGARKLAIDLGSFSGDVTATWFNPSSGQLRPAANRPLANSGVRPFPTPGDNGTKTNDWLLILEVESGHKR